MRYYPGEPRFLPALYNHKTRQFIVFDKDEKHMDTYKELIPPVGPYQNIPKEEYDKILADWKVACL